MATAAGEPPVSLAGSPLCFPFQGRARREGAVQGQVPPFISLRWAPIEELLKCAAPDGFRKWAEGYAREIVVQAWQAHPTPQEKVAHEWRNLWRRSVSAVHAIQRKTRSGDIISAKDAQAVTQFLLMRLIEPRGRDRRRRGGRHYSLTWFDSLVLLFDFSFPNLECKVNSHRNVYRGQFPELIYEVIRQIGPSINERGRIGLPSGINIRALENAGDKRSALTAIGRRIDELRKGEQRDAEGIRQLRAGEAFWRRP